MFLLVHAQRADLLKILSAGIALAKRGGSTSAALHSLASVSSQRNVSLPSNQRALTYYPFSLTMVYHFRVLMVTQRDKYHRNDQKRDAARLPEPPATRWHFGFFENFAPGRKIHFHKEKTHPFSHFSGAVQKVKISQYAKHSSKIIYFRLAICN